MFHHLCSLLITFSYWQHVASRYIVHQPFYPSYPDYNYMYSDPNPLHPSFQQHPSPFFSPPGTYFDHRQGILRPFPGGGVPVLVNYHKRCSDNFIGLRSHPDQKQYYYVCKPDCVIFGKCQNLQIYNATSNQCVQHPPPEYIPTCTGVGRFPLFSDCHLYFKCEEDLKPKIHSCPTAMIFSPASAKCINGDKCTPTQISPQSSQIPDICAHKFPPCFEIGTFRSPSDCSLYYKCDLKNNGVYMQTRLQCSQGDFYDLKKKKCCPAKEVPCDCIQVAELVYPKPNTLPFQPAVYPAHFDLDSIVDKQYPVEETHDRGTTTSKDCNRTKNEIVLNSQTTEITTVSPFDLSTESMGKTKKANMDVLPDYGGEELISMAGGFLDDSERSGFEPDTTKMSLSTAATTEEITESSTTNNARSETTDEPTTTVPERKKEDGLLHNPVKIESTTATSETEPEDAKEDTTSKDLSSQTQTCEIHIEHEGTGDTDIQRKNPSQTTQAKKCLAKHTPTKLNRATETMKITQIPRKQNEQNTTTLTLMATTAHTPTEKLTTTTKNLVATKKRNSLKEQTLDTDWKLETDGTTQSSEDRSQHSKVDTENLETKDPATTLEDTIQTGHTRSINTKFLDDYISYEDILESGITKKTKAEFLETKSSTKLDLDPIPDNHETDLQNLYNKLTTNKRATQTLESLELQRINQILARGTTTMAPPQITTIQSNSAMTHKDLLFAGTDLPLIGEDNDSAILESEIKIDAFETTIQPKENWSEENSLLTEEFIPLAENSAERLQTSVALEQTDFIDEGFIPVQSKNLKFNQIEHEKSILEKGFDDDYTTILAETEITTTSASTISNAVKPEKDKHETTLFDKITTIARRQTSISEAIQTTTQINALDKTLPNVTGQPKIHSTTAENPPLKKEESDEVDVLDSEIVIPGPVAEKQTEAETEEEVSNNEITAAETNQTSAISNQQKQMPSHSTPSSISKMTTTQMLTIKTIANLTTIPSEPSEKQTNNFILHIRKEQKQQQQPTLNPSSPSRNSLYYILKTKPVININTNISNESKTNNELLVTAVPDTDSDSGEVPRLEILAEQPIDIHFSICPTSCDKNHKCNSSIIGERAVLLKWFARKSKKTLGFETANDSKPDGV